MTKRKTGLIDAVNEMMKAMHEPLNRLADLFYGVTIKRSVHVARGQRVRLNESSAHSRQIVMHPLDAIAEECKGDPLTESLEVGVFFAEQACVELDRIPEKLRVMADEYAAAQEVRMQGWLLSHGARCEH